MIVPAVVDVSPTKADNRGNVQTGRDRQSVAKKCIAQQRSIAVLCAISKPHAVEKLTKKVKSK